MNTIANNIKGITVEIGGDTSPLNKALDGVDQKSRSLQSELKKVEKALKLDPSNTELLKQKQELLTKAVSETKDKLDLLKQAQEKVNKAHEANAKWEKEYAPIKKEIDATKEKLKGLTSQQDEMREKLSNGKISTEQYEKYQKELEETTAKSKELSSQVRALEKQFQDGHISDEQYREYQRTVVETEHKLKSLEKQAKQSNVTLGKISEVSGKVGSAAGKIGDAMMPATLAITGAGVAAVKMGSDYEESLNKSDVAFKDNAKQVESWSKTTLEKYGIASGTALDMASLFGDMGTSMGFTTKKAADMSTNLVGLAGDLASFKNIGLDEAQTALKSIFTGETESLKNLGIVMTDTNLNAYALAQGYGKTTKEMTESEKVQLRYNYVMDKTKNAQGDYARTSDGTANSTRTLTERVKELAADLGRQLAPVVTPIIQHVSNLIKKFSQLDSGTKQIILVVLGIVAAIAPIAKIIQGISMAIHFATAAQSAFNIVAAANPIVLIIAAIIAAIALLVVGFKLLWDNNEGFRKAVIKIWNGIKSTVGGVVNALVTFFTVTIPTAWNSLVAFFTGIPAWWNHLWEQVGQFFTNCWNGIISFFTTTIPAWIQSVITWFNQLPHKIGLAIGQILGHIVKFGINAFNWVTTELPKIILGVINWFGQLPGKIWVHLVNVVTKVGQWGLNLVTKVGTEIPKVITKVVNFFKELPGKIWAHLVDVVNKVKDWAGNLINTAATEIPKFVKNVVDFIGELPGKMLDIGKNIVHGIWDGICGSITWIHDKISGFCSGVVDGFKGALGIHSPSVVMKNMVGAFIPAGIWEGIESGFKPLQKNVNTCLSNLVSSMKSKLSAISVTFDTSEQTAAVMNAVTGNYPVAYHKEGNGPEPNPQQGKAPVFHQTVNNYSPKALSAAETARQTRNATRQMLLTLKG